MAAGFRLLTASQWSGRGSKPVCAGNPWPEESAFLEGAVLAVARPTSSNTMAVPTLKAIIIKGKSNTVADSVALTLGSVS
jgi:hypothetical protein